MSSRILLAITLLMLLLTGSFAQDSLVLQPNAIDGIDSRVHEGSPDDNFGTSPNFIAYDWTFGGIEYFGESFIKFDLSAIPANAVITGARLSLYHNPTSGSAGQAGDNACYLKKVSSPWIESEITWNNKPASDIAGQVLLSTSTSSTQDYPDIDILNFVAYWYDNPNSNFGMHLELVDSLLYSSMLFSSSDHADASKRPKLVIYYEPSECQFNNGLSTDLNVDGNSCVGGSLHVSQALRLEPMNSPPVNPERGTIYFDDGLNKLMVWDGAVWQACW